MLTPHEHPGRICDNDFRTLCRMLRGGGVERWLDLRQQESALRGELDFQVFTSLSDVSGGGLKIRRRKGQQLQPRKAQGRPLMFVLRRCSGRELRAAGWSRSFRNLVIQRSRRPETSPTDHCHRWMSLQTSRRAKPCWLAWQPANSWSVR